MEYKAHAGSRVTAPVASGPEDEVNQKTCDSCAIGRNPGGLLLSGRWVGLPVKCPTK